VRVCGGIAAGIGLLVLVGWILDVALLKAVVSGWTPMKANTAVGLVLIGVALSLPAGPLSRGASFGAALIGGLTVAEYAFGWDLGIDQLLFRDRTLVPGLLAPGRMAVNTATNFVLLGSASVLWGRPGRGARIGAEAFAVLAGLIALLGLYGYLLGVSDFVHPLPRYSTMAAHTAFAQFVLAVGTVASLPEGWFRRRVTSGGPGGIVARRMVPLMVIVPLWLAWMRLVGQEAGWYETRYGVALHTLGVTIILAAAVTWSAAALDQAERERLRATEALRASEARFRQLVECLPNPAWTCTPEGPCDYLSPQWLQYTGVPEARQLGYGWLEQLHPDDRDRTMAAWQAEAPRGKGFDIEFRIRRADGVYRWFETRAAPLRDESGRLVKWFGSNTDIDDLKRAESALRASEERFRQLAEHITQAFFLVDIAEGFRPLYVSPAWAVIWGRPPEQGLDPSVWFNAIHPDDQPAVRAADTAVRRGTPATTVFRIHRPDGSTRILRGRSFPVFDKSGRVYRLVGVAEDITDLRRAEEQYRQAQKMEAVGRLAGGVAHDFNNLLTVIISYAQFLREDLDPADPRRQDLEPILQAAEGAAGLTRQLLAFSRQEVIQPRAVALEEVVAQSEKLLRRVIGEDIALSTALAATPSVTSIDPGQLEQVIMNLAVNARDAMPKGGKLTIETGLVEFDEEYFKAHWPATPGRFALLAMTDTGHGMDEATRARIFEPFFTTKEPGKGTGLGLATVYGIVKRSGGFIWVYSEPGQGTTFKLYFPAVEEPAEAGVLHQVPAEVAQGSETILLCEDAPAVRAVAREILERSGYTVLEAPNGRAALDLVAKRSAPIALLITDVVMPEMSGKQLADQFKGLRPESRVLYMSGYTDDSIVRHGVLEPGIAYLQKPFSIDALVRKVREVLDAS
jgi:PAS domain S-box-containing protein